VRLSDNITLAEATKSRVALKQGIDNSPARAQLDNMALVARLLFEPLRRAFGTPIAITSFFRCPRLNDLIGGSPESQHTTGEAMDLDADVFGGPTNADLFRYLLRHMTFDQLIWELGDDHQPDWVHVSLSARRNRREVLRARRGEHGLYYVAFEEPRRFIG
jgi:hypothetical protein